MDALALQRTHTTMVVDSNQGDAPLFRRMAALAAADPRRILHRSMAERGAAKVLRWQSAELRSVAATACARALVLCEHRRRIEGWPGSRHRPPG